jgi:hypothetical protein
VLTLIHMSTILWHVLVGAGSSPATLHLGPWAFQPGSEHRAFVAVPDGATWCEMVLRAGAYDTPKLLHVRATQLAPDASYRETEWRNQVYGVWGGGWLGAAIMGSATAGKAGRNSKFALIRPILQGHGLPSSTSVCQNPWTDRMTALHDTGCR